MDERTDPNELGFDVLKAISVAKTSLRKGEPYKALEVLKPFKGESHHKGEFSLLLGTTYLEVDRPMDAIFWLEKARLQQGTLSWQGFNNLGTAYRRRKSYLKALANYASGLLVRPNQKDLLNNTLSLLLEWGRQKDALRFLQEHPIERFSEDLVWLAIKRSKEIEQVSVALKVIDRLVASKPLYKTAHIERAMLAFKLGNKDTALDYIEIVEKIDPTSTLVILNKGNFMKSLGRLEDAEAAYMQALKIDPNLAEALTNLGIIYKEQGELEKAIATHEKAIEKKPTMAIAYLNAGVALRASKNNEKAAHYYEKAALLEPGMVEAHANLGAAQKDLGQLDEAEKTLKHAIELNPDYVDAHNNLGILYRDTDRAEEGIQVLTHAVTVRPSFHQAWVNLGNLYKDIGAFDMALACYKKAASLKPDLAEAHWGQSLTLLSTGHLSEGFALYDWRIQTTEFNLSERLSNQIIWSGESLQGKKLLVTAEQGLGDTLQFIRYVPELNKLGVQVYVWIQKGLVSIISNSFPNLDIHGEAPDTWDFDYWLPLLSLPNQLFRTQGQLPAIHNYIRPLKRSLCKEWKAHLSETSMNIGIAWQGNPKSKLDRNRSISLRHYNELSSLSNVNLFSLQRGEGSEQLEEITFQRNIVPFPANADIEAAFIDTATLLSQLDYVVTSDTSIAHLSGAMGVPTLLCLQKVPEWRWGISGAETHWYSSVKIFRQRDSGNWAQVLSEVASYLEAFGVKRFHAREVTEL